MSVKKGPVPTRLAFQDDRELLQPGPMRDKLLDQMAKMGAKWVRANVEYTKTKGGTDLSAIKALADAARQRGMHVQATLMSDPEYATPGGALTYKNNDPKVWAKFAAMVAKNSKGAIDRFSVGNEMNYPAFIEGADKNPRQAGRVYRNVYREGRAAIKKVNPYAQVLFGEMTNLGTENVTQFLKGALGGKRLYTDGFAYHPYDGTNAGFDTRNLGDLQALLKANKGKLQTVRGHAPPLYLTEYGKMANTGDSASRAKLVAQAFQRAKKAGAREFLQYQLTSKTPDPSAPPTFDSYGNPTGTPQRPSGFLWDTSLGTKDGDMGVLAKALQAASARPKAAEAKARAKGARFITSR